MIIIEFNIYNLLVNENENLCIHYLRLLNFQELYKGKEERWKQKMLFFECKYKVIILLIHEWQNGNKITHTLHPYVYSVVLELNK